jgi:flagellar assembly factor FliW
MAGSVDTAKFGKVEFRSEEVIAASGGLPGFENLKRFLLIENQELEPFKFLQSLEDPVISFPLISPRLVKSDYRVALGPEELGRLELDRLEDALVFSIVTLGTSPDDASVNLFAPLVINTSKMLAAQVIMLDSGYAVAEPLLRP